MRTINKSAHTKIVWKIIVCTAYIYIYIYIYIYEKFQRMIIFIEVFSSVKRFTLELSGFSPANL